MCGTGSRRYRSGHDHTVIPAYLLARNEDRLYTEGRAGTKHLGWRALTLYIGPRHRDKGYFIIRKGDEK